MDAEKLSENISALALSNSSFTPEQIKRFIYSVLHNAEIVEERGDVLIARGLKDFIGMLLVNIYDADVQTIDETANRINVAEIVFSDEFNKRLVKSKEIAAHCMAMSRHASDAMDIESNAEYCSGLLIGIASFADIMAEEMRGEIKAERARDEQ